MKKTHRLAILNVGIFTALVGAGIYAWETSPLNKEQTPKPVVLKMPETYRDCVNRIAYDAFVDADVGDTFDAGFDAGLVAAKECSK